MKIQSLIIILFLFGCAQNIPKEIPTQPLDLQEGITRELDIINGQIQVTLYIELNEEQSYYLFDETIPEGLELVDGNDTNRHIKEVKIENAVSSVYKYTLTGASGEYTFTGEYALEGMAEPKDIMGEKTIKI